MKTIKKTVVYLFLLVASVVVFSGCHTAHGVGEDVESAGQSIQRTVQ